MRSLGCLPDLAFLALAVSYHDEYSVILFILLGCDSHSYAAGKALSQGSGGDVDSRTFLHIRMPLEDGTFLAKRIQHGLIKESQRGKRCILDRAYMPFG